MSENALSVWFTRIILILMCISPFLIMKEGTKCYGVLACKTIADDYVLSAKNGYIGYDEYKAFVYRVAEYGYETEISVTHYDGEYYDYISEEKMMESLEIIHGMEVFKLQNGDYVKIRLSKKDSVISTSAVYRGDWE